MNEASNMKNAYKIIDGKPVGKAYKYMGKIRPINMNYR
jgi:hypothetical protein